MKKELLFLLLPAFAFASGAGTGETDIIYRTINFLIFAAILYRLLAEPAKNFFVGRQKGIADKLQSIQDKVKESKTRKSEAIAKVEEAKVNAKSIIQTAKKEAQIVSNKISADLKDEIDNMLKNHEENKEIERRKMVRGVVSEIIEEMFSEGTVALKDEDFVNIIMKKVA